MKFNSNFKYDLEVGKVAEQALADILENKTIEVKRDLKAKTTGNVFVEFESRGKPSGIATSEADFWCFVLGDRFVLIEADALKKLVEPLKGTKSERRGGDNNTSKGVLIKTHNLITTHDTHE
jgi:hypothetical protein